MKSYLKGKFSKIIAVIIISAIAGGAAKDFLFPTKYSNHAFKNSSGRNSNENSNKTSSVENSNANSNIISQVKQFCPDCDNQIQILNNIIKNNPEAIETFKKHFNKLNKEDLQQIFEKITPSKEKTQINIDTLKQKANDIISSQNLKDHLSNFI